MLLRSLTEDFFYGLCDGANITARVLSRVRDRVENVMLRAGLIQIGRWRVGEKEREKGERDEVGAEKEEMDSFYMLTG
jgi:hypothetical protein